MGLDYLFKLLFNSIENNTNYNNVGAFDIKYYFPSFFVIVVLPSGYVFGWVIASQYIIMNLFKENNLNVRFNLNSWNNLGNN